MKALKLIQKSDVIQAYNFNVVVTVIDDATDDNILSLFFTDDDPVYTYMVSEANLKKAKINKNVIIVKANGRTEPQYTETLELHCFTLQPTK